MPIDVTHPRSTDPDGRSADKLAELDRRLGRLETGAAIVTAAAGAPAANVTSKFYVDTTNNYLYVRITPGVYRRTATLV